MRTEIATDQATEAHLEKIAERYRWHIDEVRQEYQKTGDLISTQDAIASYRRIVEEYKIQQELDEI
jgi:Uri superfamily endonuclease